MWFQCELAILCWQLSIKCDGLTRAGLGSAVLGEKDLKVIRREMGDVIRQITSCVTFLPSIDQACEWRRIVGVVHISVSYLLVMSLALIACAEAVVVPVVMHGMKVWRIMLRDWNKLDVLEDNQLCVCAEWEIKRRGADWIAGTVVITGYKRNSNCLEMRTLYEGKCLTRELPR